MRCFFCITNLNELIISTSMIRLYFLYKNLTFTPKSENLLIIDSYPQRHDKQKRNVTFYVDLKIQNNVLC